MSNVIHLFNISNDFQVLDVSIKKADTLSTFSTDKKIWS